MIYLWCFVYKLLGTYLYASIVPMWVTINDSKYISLYVEEKTLEEGAETYDKSITYALLLPTSQIILCSLELYSNIPINE